MNRATACLPVILVVWACSGEGPDQPQLLPLGGECVAHEECESGRCLLEWDHLPSPGYCTQSCETDPCPVEYTCGISTDGSRICSWTIITGCSPREEEYYCEGSTPVSCARAPDWACWTCGCSEGYNCTLRDGNTFDGGLCLIPRPVGEECWYDEWCQSENCSTRGEPGRCLVPLGTPCTGANCQVCHTGDGWSFCTRVCEYESHCPWDFGCVRRYGESTHHCWKKCNPAAPDCPGDFVCEPVTYSDSPSIAYHACL
jgi:hypothetical protein